MPIKIKFRTDYADINNTIYEFEDSITISEMIDRFLKKSHLLDRDKNKTLCIEDGKNGLWVDLKVGGYDFVYNGNIIGQYDKSRKFFHKRSDNRFLKDIFGNENIVQIGVISTIGIVAG